MSAHFIVQFRGQPGRFTYRAGQRIFEIVPRGMATRFSSEPEAWHAAYQHQLTPQFVTVESAKADPRPRTTDHRQEALCS